MPKELRRVSGIADSSGHTLTLPIGMPAVRASRKGARRASWGEKSIDGVPIDIRRSHSTGTSVSLEEFGPTPVDPQSIADLLRATVEDVGVAISRVKLTPRYIEDLGGAVTHITLESDAADAEIWAATDSLHEFILRRLTPDERRQIIVELTPVDAL